MLVTRHCSGSLAPLHRGLQRPASRVHAMATAGPQKVLLVVGVALIKCDPVGLDARYTADSADSNAAAAAATASAAQAAAAAAQRTAAAAAASATIAMQAASAASTQATACKPGNAQNLASQAAAQAAQAQADAAAAGEAASAAQAAASTTSGVRVLLAQRPQGKDHAGLWEFPGGKVEEGETPEAALVRELQEELGLQVCSSDLTPLSFVSWPYPGRFHLLMPLYSCTRWTGQARGKEGQAIAWVTQQELLQYQLTPADVPLLPCVVKALNEAATNRFAPPRAHTR
ncbi:NUDIX hydrolase domain-like protein [Haematococcus lacustris]